MRVKKLVNDTNNNIILYVKNKSLSIFPLSNVTARQQCSPAGQQFSRCREGEKKGRGKNRRDREGKKESVS